MLEGINLEEVKKYNASLKQYKDRATTLNAEIEYTNKELDALCLELSNELGVSVTRENIEQIYNEQVSKINSILQSGNAVLSKIATEEKALSDAAMPQAQVVQQPQQMTQASQQMAQAPVMGGIASAPQIQPAHQMQSAPTPIFNDNVGVSGSSTTNLPPMFKI